MSILSIFTDPIISALDIAQIIFNGTFMGGIWTNNLPVTSPDLHHVVGMHIYFPLHFFNIQTWGRSIPMSSTSLTANNAYPAACSNNTCKSTWDRERDQALLICPNTINHHLNQTGTKSQMLHSYINNQTNTTLQKNTVNLIWLGWVAGQHQHVHVAHMALAPPGTKQLLNFTYLTWWIHHCVSRR